MRWDDQMLDLVEATHTLAQHKMNCGEVNVAR